MPYRVDLDLDRGQVKQLHQLALNADTSVRGLVTQLVVDAIKDAGSKAKKSKKQEQEKEEK